jgi:arginase family enzyme
MLGCDGKVSPVFTDGALPVSVGADHLIALGPADHRLHHIGLLDMRGNADDPDGVILTDATGRIVDHANQTGRAPT